MTAHDGRCRGCEDLERLGRRRFLELLASGVALVLAGCTTARRAATRSTPSTTAPPVAPTAPIVIEPMAGPPVRLGEIPPPQPGPPRVLSAGPLGTQQIALTVDDGFCA